MRPYLMALVVMAVLSGCSDSHTAATGATAEDTVAKAMDSVAAPPGSLDLSSLSLKQLHERAQHLAAKSRQLGSDMQRDIDDTKRRLGARANDPSSNREAERIRQRWPAAIQEVEADIQATMEEIRKRCPLGTVLDGSEQSCN